jgi:hypothetical protein
MEYVPHVKYLGCGISYVIDCYVHVSMYALQGICETVNRIKIKVRKGVISQCCLHCEGCIMLVMTALVEGYSKWKNEVPTVLGIKPAPLLHSTHILNALAWD